MLKKYIQLLIILTLVCACGISKKTSLHNEDQTSQTKIQVVNKQIEKPHADRYYQMQKRGVDFFASGNEPFWSVEIDFDNNIKLTILFDIDSLVVPVSEPIVVMDAPMVCYKGSSEQGEIRVSIELQECVDNMSGIKNPYVVSVSVKQIGEERYYELKGCGEYYGSVRLHDIWALQSINGIKVDASKFDNHPFMELHLNNGRAMGFLGCNSFSTQFFFGRNQIFFKHIISTKMACPLLDFEYRYLKALSNKLLNYRFEGLNLILENNTDTMVFKKVD